MLTTRLGGGGPPVVGTIQNRKVLIPKQVFPMLGQIAVDRLPTHIIQVDLVRRKHPPLRGAPSHHDLSSCRRTFFFLRPAARPGTCFRSGKRTSSKCVRSTTFQVTVSPGSRSRAAARGKGTLA